MSSERSTNGTSRVDSPVTTAEPEAVSEPFLHLNGLVKRFGDLTAVDHLDVAVKEGELVAFLGPSGCGKTTTLRMLAGFIDLDGGSIAIDGKRVDQLPSRSRGTAMVFQDYALFPHMTAFDNVAFGLKMRKVDKQEIARRVDLALKSVQLPDVGDKYPRELSGGMKQRVALARAIVVEPRILLLDEPLSNLDAKLRKQLRVELREIHERVGITTVFVTHDIEEAFFLADRVVVMNAGKLEQFDAPSTIYSKPASQFVADFVGHTNMIMGEWRPGPDGHGEFHGAGLTMFTVENPTSTHDGMYTIPPHCIQLSTGPEAPASRNALKGKIHLVAFLGASYQLLVDVGDTRFQCDIVAGSHDVELLEAGRHVWLHWDPSEGNYVSG